MTDLLAFVGVVLTAITLHFQRRSVSLQERLFTDNDMPRVLDPPDLRAVTPGAQISKKRKRKPRKGRRAG